MLATRGVAQMDPRTSRAAASPHPSTWTGRLACTCVALAMSAFAAGAAAQPVNPHTIEFDPPRQDRDITGYRIELFPSDVDVASAVPLRTLNVARLQGGESLKVDLRRFLRGVPNGTYVATVRSLSRQGASARSAPTEPFTIADPDWPPEEDPPPLPPAPPPMPPSQTPDPDRPPDDEPWPWTLIGIAMGIAAFVLPFLFR